VSRPIALLLVVATALALGVATALARDKRAPTASAQQITEMPRLETEVFVMINELRLSKGLGELRLNRALSLFALGHSVSMAEHGFFDHSGWDGSPFSQRIEPQYPPFPHGSWAVGENMVWASPRLSANQAIEMWLKSPHHRKILLARAWREIGLGAVRAFAAPGIYQGLDVTIFTADFSVR
jgi:uncharacterized protein YkwD